MNKKKAVVALGHKALGITLPEQKIAAHEAGFRHLLFLLNLRNPFFMPLPAYFFVNFFGFSCCMVLYFIWFCAIIIRKRTFLHETVLR